MWVSSFSSNICGKDNLFSIILLFLLCWRSVGCIYVDLLLGVPFCSIDLFIILLPISYSINYNRFIVTWCSVVSVLQLSLLLQYCVGYFMSFDSLYKLYKQFVDIHKLPSLDFDWNCIESIDQAGKNWYFGNNKTFP